MNIIASIITIFALAAVVLTIKKSKRILALYAIARPVIQPFIFLQYKLYLIPYSIVWATFLPAVFIANIFNKSWRIIFRRSTPLLMILFWAALSLPFTIDIKASIEGIFKLIAVFCAFCIAYNSIKTIKDIDEITNSIIYSSIIPIILGFYQEISGKYDQLYSYASVDRVNSVFGVGNAFGIFLSITMCATMMMLLKQGITMRVRLFLITVISMMIASQVLALNRGTWIAFSIAITISVLAYSKKIKIKWFFIGFIIIAVVFSGTIYKRLTTVEYRWTGEERDTFRGRILYWERMLPLIMKRPILGYGVGIAGESEEINDNTPPHNDYVRLAIDIGIPGSLIYLCFLISLVAFYIHRRSDTHKLLVRYNFPMTVLTIYMIVISMTQNIIYNQINFVLFMILNGAVIKINTLQENSQLPR